MSLSFKKKRKFIKDCEGTSDERVRKLVRERIVLFKNFLIDFVPKGMSYKPTKVKKDPSMVARKTKVGYY